MATLTKERARKPLIEKSPRIWTGTGHDGNLTFKVSVSDVDPGGDSYTLELTADEMMLVVSDWMKVASRDMALSIRPRNPR